MVVAAAASAPSSGGEHSRRGATMMALLLCASPLPSAPALASALVLLSLSLMPGIVLILVPTLASPLVLLPLSVMPGIVLPFVLTLASPLVLPPPVVVPGPGHVGVTSPPRPAPSLLSDKLSAHGGHTSNGKPGATPHPPPSPSLPQLALGSGADSLSSEMRTGVGTRRGAHGASPPAPLPALPPALPLSPALPLPLPESPRWLPPSLNPNVNAELRVTALSPMLRVPSKDDPLPLPLRWCVARDRGRQRFQQWLFKVESDAARAIKRRPNLTAMVCCQGGEGVGKGFNSGCLKLGPTLRLPVVLAYKGG